MASLLRKHSQPSSSSPIKRPLSVTSLKSLKLNFFLSSPHASPLPSPPSPSLLKTSTCDSFVTSPTLRCCRFLPATKGSVCRLISLFCSSLHKRAATQWDDNGEREEKKNRHVHCDRSAKDPTGGFHLHFNLSVLAVFFLFFFFLSLLATTMS